jgi:hypothetical protein
MTMNGENLATGNHVLFQVPLRHSFEETREKMKILLPAAPPRWVKMSGDNKAWSLHRQKLLAF